MFGRLLGSFIIKPTKFVPNSNLFVSIRNINTTTEQKILRWKKVNDLPLSMVKAKFFLTNDEDKLLLTHHAPLRFAEPNLWAVDTDSFGFKKLSEVSPPPIFIDPLDLQQLPVTKEFLDSYTQKLKQNLNKINKNNDVVRAYYEDYTSIQIGEMPTKISDEERKNIRKNNIAYFAAFNDQTPFSVQFSALLDNLVLQLLTPEDLAIAAPLSQSFIVDLLTTIKNHKGKSNTEIFDSLIAKYNVPKRNTSLRGVIDFGAFDKWIWMLNQRGQSYWLYSTLENVDGIFQDYTMAALVQKMGAEQWKSMSETPCPLIPDLFRQNMQPQVWGIDAPKFSPELDKCPIEWKTETYRIYNVIYEKGVADLVRDSSYRLGISQDEAKNRAQQRVSQKFSYLSQYQNSQARFQLLEVPNDEALAPLKQALASVNWETAEVIYKESESASTAAKELLRLTKVKVPSDHHNRVLSYLETAIFSRYFVFSANGNEINRAHSIMQRDSELVVQPLNEVRWDHQVSLDDGRILCYQVGIEQIEGEVRAAILNTSGVTATAIEKPPFMNGIGANHNGTVYVIGWVPSECLPFEQEQGWKPSAVVWSYDTKASHSTWKRIETSGKVPEVVLGSHETTSLVIKNKIYYIIPKEANYEIYTLDLNTHVWDKLETNGVQPTPLYGAQIIAASMFGKQKIVALFGNVQNDWENHPDSKNIFILDIESLTWESDPTVVGDVPQGRKDIASIFYPKDGIVIVAGGRTEERTFQDIYTLSVEKESKI